MDQAGNIIGQIVDKATSAVDEAGNIVDPEGNIIGNIADTFIDTAGNIINQTGSIIGQVAADVVNANGDILDKAGNIIGSVFNKAVDAAGNILNSAGTIIGNIFGLAGNIFQKAVDVGTGIIGKVTQIAGSALQIPINIFGKFANLVGGIVGKLGEFSTGLINLFGNVVNAIANIGKGIVSTFADFFTKSIAGITDFIVNPALKLAKAAYDKVVAAVTSAIDTAKTNIAQQVDAFDAKMKAAVATALNKVSDLAADLTKKLSESKASAALIADCGAKLNTALKSFAENAVPYLGECIAPSATFNITDLAIKAVATAGGTLEQAKAVVAKMQACIDPVLAAPKDSAAKTTAKTCLSDVSY